MRIQTARERAETQVVLIRGMANVIGPRDCAWMAAVHYGAAEIDWDYTHKIVCLWDAGRFEEAWAVLTDYYEEKFSDGLL